MRQSKFINYIGRCIEGQLNDGLSENLPTCEAYLTTSSIFMELSFFSGVLLLLAPN